MRVLVLGATGFIGARLSAALAASGHDGHGGAAAGHVIMANTGNAALQDRTLARVEPGVTAGSGRRTLAEELLSHLKLGEVERLRYVSTGGTSVDGWVVKPPGFDRSTAKLLQKRTAGSVYDYKHGLLSWHG